MARGYLQAAETTLHSHPAGAHWSCLQAIRALPKESDHWAAPLAEAATLLAMYERPYGPWRLSKPEGVQPDHPTTDNGLAVS